MNPTSDARIFETEWFRQPNSLLETKIYHSLQDGLMYYIFAYRGMNITLLAKNEPTGALIDEPVLQDNSLEQFNKLVKVLSTPAR
jgi:hypothetical protein